jgi:hypothetical protein
MLIYRNSNSGVHQATDAALPLQEFRPSFPSAIFVETRDSGTCWDELDCGIGSRVGEANFRLARYPPTMRGASDITVGNPTISHPGSDPEES